MSKMQKPDKTPLAVMRKKHNRKAIIQRRKMLIAISTVPRSGHPWRKGWVGP